MTTESPLTDDQLNQLHAALQGHEDAAAEARTFTAGLLGGLYHQFEDRGDLESRQVIWYAIKEAAENFATWEYTIIDFITDTGIFEIHDHGVYTVEEYDALREG